MVGAASFLPFEPLAPGSLISIFGTRLAEGREGARGLPLDMRLAGTEVVIAGRRMPLLFSSDGQINALLPYDLNMNTSYRFIVRRGPTLSLPVDVNMAPAQPAVFRPDPTQDQGHIYKFVDQAIQLLADATNPVAAGDAVIVYCSGLGAVDPPVEAGQAAPASPLSQTVNPVRLTIGGVAADVFFAGLSPGFSGLHQINAFVPAGVAPSDSAPVVVEVAGRSSPVVTAAVR